VSALQINYRLTAGGKASRRQKPRVYITLARVETLKFRTCQENIPVAEIELVSTPAKREAKGANDDENSPFLMYPDAFSRHLFASMWACRWKSTWAALSIKWRASGGITLLIARLSLSLFQLFLPN